jgi:hypothetical protein
MRLLDAGKDQERWSGGAEIARDREEREREREIWFSMYTADPG